MVFKWLVPIQIHLLFLFIATTPTGKPKSLHSNTSLVLIYQCYGVLCTGKQIIQIRLMFLFILRFLAIHSMPTEFKYISCSYLSVVKDVDADVPFGFKYISCSYLS